MADEVYGFLYDLERVDFCAEGLHYLPRIQYGRKHPRQHMECIYKDGLDKYPVLIWIHGGGWRDENLTATYRPEKVLARLAQMGWFVACIEYRLAQHGIFPISLQDCEDAVKFLRTEHEKFRLDPGKIAVWGESAGAHLACMVAANLSKDAEKQVQAVVSWYCPSDLSVEAQHQLEEGEENFVVGLVGTTEDHMYEKIISASPVTYADQPMPPILLMHGDVDNLVDYEQSVRYAQKLQAAGNDVTFVTVPGQGHGFFRGQQYYDTIVGFLEKKVRKCK